MTLPPFQVLIDRHAHELHRYLYAVVGPADAADSFQDVPLPEIAGSHHWTDWAEACVGKAARPLAPFDYSGPLTEAVLLGSVAVRFPQTTLEWNSNALRFTNVPAANAFVRREYRDGWRVAGL